MNIGFIGLGTMGRPMARNLLGMGGPLRVWNRSREPVEALAEEGAQATADPAEAAAAEILVSMLADDVAVRQVVLEGGALAAMAAGSVHVNMATVSVDFARELADRHGERGVGYISAPVLGRADMAAAGKLNILAAGPDEALTRVQPLFDVLGQKTWRFGARPEQANVVKLAANFCLASAIETMAESSALVRAHGISGAGFLEMLYSTLFAAPAYRGYGEMIAEERFSPAGFRLVLGLKDIRLALAAAEAGHVPLPVASVLRDNLLDAVAQGDGDLDWAALAKVAARRAGLE